MKHILVFFIVIFSSLGRADLLDRMKLEESFKTRIEDAFRIYDPEARAVLRFEYKNFKGTLPGISNEMSQSDFTPRSIETSDISRLSVEIYTKIDTVNEDIKNYILKVIPIEKRKISISYRKLSPLTEKQPFSTLDPKSFSEILRNVMDSFTKSLAIGFAVLFVIGLGIIYQRDSRKFREFKTQVQILSSAMAERGSAPLTAQTPLATNNSRTITSGSFSGNYALKNLDLSFLKEVFADCYWSHEDAYAHWLWKNIESSQKSALIAQLPLLKEYSLYFVELEPAELSYHEHPYYLEPLGLLYTSQEDLSEEIKKDFSLWHFLSPMRQQTMPLSLEDRLKAIQTKPDGKKPKFSEKNQSRPRTLETKLSWGELSADDERTLFDHPDMVPISMRQNIQSLVWLAQKEDSFIQNALSRYDARSLASAWVGPEEVLSKLQAQLPEKKLKLLLTYKEKLTPTRNSPIYISLVAEGLRNEAA